MLMVVDMRVIFNNNYKKINKKFILKFQGEFANN